MNAVLEDFGGNLCIPDNFEQTVPAYDPEKSRKENQCPPARTEINPQTKLICSMLDLTNPNAVFLGLDSSFKLADDADLDNSENVDDDDDDDVDDDTQSEASFVSLSESERSYSDRSFSFMSTGNDSVLSVGTGNESIVSLGNIDENSIDGTDELENDNGKNGSVPNDDLSGNTGKDSPLVQVQNLSSAGKRLSLSERLKNCKPSDASSPKPEVVSKEAGDGEDNDDEFAEIMSAQKSEKQESSMESDSDVAVCKNSSSSADCNTPEISEDDPELREMLQVQKSVREGDKAERKTVEISAEPGDVDIEFHEIVAAQKKNQTLTGDDSEFQRDFQVGVPAVQSSPIVNIDSKLAENEGNLVQAQKRLESQKPEAKSPAAKKFKRRNVAMYQFMANEEDKF